MLERERAPYLPIRMQTACLHCVVLLASGIFLPLSAQQQQVDLSAPAPNASAQLAHIHELVEHAQFKEAETALRSVLSANSSDADGAFRLATCCSAKTVPKTRSRNTRLLRNSARLAEHLRNVALDYVLLNGYSDAEKWARRSLQMNSSDPETWYVLGRIAYTNGKLPDAKECFKHSLALAPGSVKAENNLGLVYEGLNRTDDAIHAYRTAIESQHQKSDRPSEQPLINLAIVLTQRSDLESALKLLLQAVAIAPKDERAREQSARYTCSRIVSAMRRCSSRRLSRSRPAIRVCTSSSARSTGNKAWRRRRKPSSRAPPRSTALTPPPLRIESCRATQIGVSHLSELVCQTLP